jgi:hypothetical protein
VFYLVYLITGGVVFAALEAPEEKAVKSALARTRRIFLETHPCVSGTFYIPPPPQNIFFSGFPRLFSYKIIIPACTGDQGMTKPLE